MASHPLRVAGGGGGGGGGGAGGGGALPSRGQRAVGEPKSGHHGAQLPLRHRSPVGQSQFVLHTVTEGGRQ